ncbi:hypothetical protein ACW7BJ_27685 [Azospirillum argentinense]
MRRAWSTTPWRWPPARVWRRRRADDASPCRQTRAGLLEAERAYRAALGWTAEQIIAAQRVVNDRLNTFFGEPQK